MEKIRLQTTKDKEVVDRTNELNKTIAKNKSKAGLCHLFLPHSTAGLTTALISSENELDLIDAFDRAVPHISKQRHKHEHSHIVARLPDHIISSFLGTSLAIPIVDGKLAIGEFQRIVRVE